MPNEHAMLLNIDLRRSKLANAPFVIRNAIFSENMRDLVCENTYFINCDFVGAVIIHVKSFIDVKFSNCTIINSRIGSGKWHDVVFDKCKAQGEFRIVAGNGSQNVTFNECILTGGTPQKSSNPEDRFGTAGAVESAAFINCDLTYMSLNASTGLMIKDSRLNMVDAITQRDRGILTLDNVEIKEYLDLSAGIFSSIKMKNVRFEYIDMKNVKTETFTMEGCSGHFFGKALSAKQVTVRNCTFGANGNFGNPSERENAGFSTIYAKINSLQIEDVKFIGTNGLLFLGGAVNLMYKKDEPKYGGPIDFTVYGKISIKNTSLKGAFLSYLQCDDLDIEHCDVDGADFVNSKIERMNIQHSTFSGKTDFSSTVIGHFSEKDNLRKVDAKIIPDANKLVTI